MSKAVRYGIQLIACVTVLHFFNFALAAIPDTIYLKPPGNAGAEKVRFDSLGNVTHIAHVVNPRLLVYKPHTASGNMIIICPGGGYTNLNLSNPSTLARQLNEYGFTVFVLIYRLPGDQNIPITEHFNALEDLRSGINVIRKKSVEWGFSNSRIILWGSSAGAHLAALQACNRNFQYSGKDSQDKPDYLVLTFPVINPAVLKNMDKLLAESKNEPIRKNFYPVEFVSTQSPETFIVHASDDSTVSAMNSIEFYQALYRNKVPAEMHIYKKGGHGFGFEENDHNSWMKPLMYWLQEKGLMNKQFNNKVDYGNIK